MTIWHLINFNSPNDILFIVRFVLSILKPDFEQFYLVTVKHCILNIYREGGGGQGPRGILKGSRKKSFFFLRNQRREFKTSKEREG